MWQRILDSPRSTRTHDNLQDKKAYLDYIILRLHGSVTNQMFQDELFEESPEREEWSIIGRKMDLMKKSESYRGCLD